MSYYLEHEGSEHLRVLRSTLLAWAKDDQDIYLVSQVGAQKQTIMDTNKQKNKPAYQKQQTITFTHMGKDGLRSYINRAYK